MLDFVTANTWVAGESRLARAEWVVVDGGADGVLTADSVQVANVITLVIDTRLFGRTVIVLHTFRGLGLAHRLALGLASILVGVSHVVRWTRAGVRTRHVFALS